MIREMNDRGKPMDKDALREFVTQSLRTAAVLAALGATLNAKVTGEPLDPKIQTRINESFDALGMSGVTNAMSAEESEQLLAEIRFHTLMDAKLLQGAARSSE